MAHPPRPQGGDNAGRAGAAVAGGHGAAVAEEPGAAEPGLEARRAVPGPQTLLVAGAGVAAVANVARVAVAGSSRDTAGA